MKNVTLSAKWLGVVFAALFLAACSSNETKEAEAAASAAAEQAAQEAAALEAEQQAQAAADCRTPLATAGAGPMTPRSPRARRPRGQYFLRPRRTCAGGPGTGSKPLETQRVRRAGKPVSTARPCLICSARIFEIWTGSSHRRMPE